MKPLTGYNGSIQYALERGGDIKHSLADISQAQKHLGYKVLVNFEDGLRRTVEWYKTQSQPAEASIVSNRWIASTWPSWRRGPHVCRGSDSGFVDFFPGDEFIQVVAVRP